MDADFSVELAAEDESLEFPWAAPDDSCRYYDLRGHPELLEQLEEVRRVPELGALLTAVNAAQSPIESAKCDAWSTEELNPEEDIYNAAWKFGCYVDLIFRDAEFRFSFAAHEHFLKRAVADLQHEPGIHARAELLLRRCHFHVGKEISDGYYITLYVFGFGEDEDRARENWRVALNTVQKTLPHSGSSGAQM